MSITQARLDAYLDAEAKVLRGQAYQLGDQRLDRADLAEIRKAIADLQRQVATEQAISRGQSGTLRYKSAVFG